MSSVFSGIGTMFGTKGGDQGAAGMNYEAEKAPILNPTTTDQAGNAYDQSQLALIQQQNFINALQRQNGLGNQSNVFQQQQALANQLQGVANGTGPNPALAQLNQSTGQNIAAQTAMMAGQRGASANAGLMARQAAMQGANIQQQSVGQGATLQAQQQLGAMGALQGQQSAMGSMANQMAGQLGQATMGYNQAAQSEQQNLLNSIAQQNNANVSMQGNQNTANAEIAKGVSKGQQGALAGITSAAGNLSVLGMAHGGMVQKFVNGGMAEPSMPPPPASNYSLMPQSQIQSMGPQPSSFVGQYFQGNFNSAPSNQNAQQNPQQVGGGSTYQGESNPMYDATKSVSQDLGKLLKAGYQKLFKTPTKPDAEEVSDKLANSGASANATMGDTMGSSAGNATGAMMGAGMGEAAAGSAGDAAAGSALGGAAEEQGASDLGGLAMFANKGGKIPNYDEGGETGEDDSNKMNLASMIPMLVALLQKGGPVGGKAKIAGDSIKNDTVPAMLSPGEVVIPRHVMQSNDPVGNSAKFVAAVLARKNGSKKSK